MTISLGLNISSLLAQRQLGRSSDQLSSVFERLSSGQRINRASDDAAGLAIADTLNADVRVYTQGIRNLNDGLSVLNIADGALQELTNITFRLAELAEQAANGTLGVAQRSSLNEEAQALKAEYLRITKSTEFNGRKLFSSSYGRLNLQAGYGNDGILGDSLGGKIGTGEFSELSLSNVFEKKDIADVNGDGNLDIISGSATSIRLSLGNGDGTFQSFMTVGSTIGSITDLSFGDINGDGNVDIIASGASTVLNIFLGNGDGSYQGVISSPVSSVAFDVEVADFNGDGKDDVLSRTGSFIQMQYGQGDGSLSAVVTSALNYVDVGVVDVENDGVLELVTITNSELRIYQQSGDGTFALSSTASLGTSAARSMTIGDFNGDGYSDVATANYDDNNVSVLFGTADGNFSSATLIDSAGELSFINSGDFNGDAVLDLMIGELGGSSYILIGAGGGTFETERVISQSMDEYTIIEDYNNDGVLDSLHSASAVLLGVTTSGVSPLLDFSLSTISDAKHALSRFQQKLDQFTEQRAQIGAFQARIGLATNVLSASIENFKAAESRIRDADIAKESAELVRLQILQQASAAVLGQANLQPQLVLKLLGGSG